MNKNGYFKLESRADGTYFIYFPPCSGGKSPSVKEVTNYLLKYGFNDYDGGALNTILSSNKRAELMIGAPLSHVINELCSIEVSLDKLKATIRFYPPTQGGDLISESEVSASLRNAKITADIDTNELDDFFSNRQYCTDYTIATGKLPVRGKDGSVQYCFPTEKNFKPKYNEDGSVDFKELNTINFVKPGDVIATLIPEKPGENGFNVYGAVLNCNVVAPGKFNFGNGMHVSDDGQELISDVMGQVGLAGDCITINETIDFPNDIDASTGNIRFDGSCEIKGSVRTGYTVDVGGDVVIGGVVEGAIINAKGNITVRHGVQGGERAILNAGGNIYCKFIESAQEVVAGNNIEADAILHSNVNAGNLIKVSGSRGIILGGSVHCDKIIEANFVGGEMSANTMLSVGTGLAISAELKEINAKMAQHKEAVDESFPIVMQMQQILKKGQQIPTIKLGYFNDAAIKFRDNKQAFDSLKIEHDRLTRQLQSSSFCKIKIHKEINPGTVIEIDGIYSNIKDKNGYCYYCKERGEIYCKNL